MGAATHMGPFCVMQPTCVSDRRDHIDMIHWDRIGAEPGKNRVWTVRESTWMSALHLHAMKYQKALLQVTLSHLHKWLTQLGTQPSDFDDLKIIHIIISRGG